MANDSAGVTGDPGTQRRNSPRLLLYTLGGGDITIQWITPCACTVARLGEKGVQNAERKSLCILGKAEPILNQY